MKRRTLIQSISAAALLPAANLLATDKKSFDTHAAESDAVYELRVYHCYEGKLPDLLKRFREHTTKIFAKHGIKDVPYCFPLYEPQKPTTLLSILAHPT